MVYTQTSDSTSTDFVIATPEADVKIDPSELLDGRWKLTTSVNCLLADL